MDKTNLMALIEERGKAPILGWVHNRKVPVNLYKTDIRKTFKAVRRLEGAVNGPARN